MRIKFNCGSILPDVPKHKEKRWSLFLATVFFSLMSPSGYSLNGQAARVPEKGCNGFIQKPYRIVHLPRKIREILDKEIIRPA